MGEQNESVNRVIKMPRLFTGMEVKSVLNEIRGLVDECSYGIVLDFADTEMIDSTGIGGLVTVSQQIRPKGLKLVLCELRQSLLRIFTDTGIASFFDIENFGRIKPAAEVSVSDQSEDLRLKIVKEEVEDICILELIGVMNHPEGSHFFKKNMLMSMAKHCKIILDFKRLVFFDTLSIGSVLKISKLLKENGGGLKVCCANSNVKDTFSTLNLNSIIPLHADREAALNSWK
ncbi:STAS domain-containing protein [Chitinispirillales bacterium ANBcel5]|uniref:STAS domain-containing protein n=1 Tax=Cellulosispirillum alkaliphilum TaxID=3039283 RepID=UPI002A5453F5|nr:STAS domain-containing protein [Chitinispirillales bacterium ANBcel5]